MEQANKWKINSIGKINKKWFDLFLQFVFPKWFFSLEVLKIFVNVFLQVEKINKNNTEIIKKLIENLMENISYLYITYLKCQ